MEHTKDARHWDIFCRVIDNFGDIGVSWRLACQLAARGMAVRLWIDDDRALQWMAPQGCAGVEVLPWGTPLQLPDDLTPGDVLVESFGCEVPTEFVERWVGWRRVDGQRPIWINLEYLSAEAYVARSHGLPSPVMSGPGRGLTKHFFYPGFTPATGGLLREADLSARQAVFDREAWLATHGVVAAPDQPLMSLFCYEPRALPQLLEGVVRSGALLLVTAGRATAAMQQALAAWGGPQPELRFLPWMSQSDFDHLLWSCDLNFVRGEDSLVRALWAGRPFVWQLYPQDDGAHEAKLEAFLTALAVPPALADWHRTWNVMQPTEGGATELLCRGDSDAARWARQARDALCAQPDLVTQLCRFVEARRQDGKTG